MLDLWNNLIKGDDRDLVDEILQGQSQPVALYLKSAGLFYDLNIMAQEAIDECLDRSKGAESRFTHDIAIPMYAIIAYCDTYTNIDTRCIIELLHSIKAELTTVKTFGKDQSSYPLYPKRSKEEIEYLKRQLWITDNRLMNHLYTIATPEQRTGIYEAKRKERELNEAIVDIGTLVVEVDENGENKYLPLRECIHRLSKEFPECEGWSTERFSRRLGRLCEDAGIEPPKRKPGRNPL